MVSIGPFSIDVYLPAMPTMAGVFGVDIVQVNNTLSAYLMGYALGQMLGGPISDQVGRRKIGFIGLTVFVVASAAITISTSIDLIVAIRTLQAIGAGFATVICMAMIRDAYEPAEAAKRYPLMMLVVLMAPLVAPAVGSILLDLGWQAIFVFLGVYGMIILGLFFSIPETAPAITGKVRFARILPQYFEVSNRKADGKRTPLRYILTMGFASAVVMIFVTNASFVYIEYFNISPKRFPLFFGANVVAMMVCTLATARLIGKVSPFVILRIGCWIQLVMIGILVVLLVTIDVPLWLFTLLISLTVGAVGLISPSASALYMAHFDRLAGSASSLASIAMFLFGGILGATSGLFYDGSLQPIAFTMAASVLIANIFAATISRRAPRH